MKRLSLSLSVVILALSSAVSASDFEEDKQYISCRKGAVNDRQLTACQERLLERLDMSIAKALDRNMTLLAESERITAQRYQSQWESWRQSHCDYSLRKQNDQQHLSLACYLQAARDRPSVLKRTQEPAPTINKIRAASTQGSDCRKAQRRMYPTATN